MPLGSAFKPDFRGQLLKVSWPCNDVETPDGGVYGFGAAWAEFNTQGELIRARRASDEEVRWWMSLQAANKILNRLDTLTMVMKRPR